MKVGNINNLFQLYCVNEKFMLYSLSRNLNTIYAQKATCDTIIIFYNQLKNVKNLRLFVIKNIDTNIQKH